jgi:hypothetical protein
VLIVFSLCRESLKLILVDEPLSEVVLSQNKIVPDSRVHVEEKLGFFLYMLSHNSSYEDLQITFHHNNDTLHHHINHFFKKVIPTLSRHFLKAPDPNLVHPKITKILDSFRSLGTATVLSMALIFLFQFSLKKILLLEIGRGH